MFSPRLSIRRRPDRPLLPWAISIGLLMDLDDAHAETERLLGRRAVEEGHSEDDVAIGLTIHHARNCRRRAAYRGTVHSFWKLSSLLTLLCFIWLAHSEGYPPQYFETLSVRSMLERYTFHSNCCEQPPEELRDSSQSRRARVRRDDSPLSQTRDLTFDTETPDMLDPITPKEMRRIAGEGRPEMKLEDCWAKPAPENRLHFKLLGEVTGNDGMIHFAVNIPLDQLVSNLANYCKLPKLVVDYLEKEHAPAGRPTARWRGDKHTNQLPKGPASPKTLPGESGELKYIYHTLARRCKLLLDETNDLYHLFHGPISHGHKIEERWTGSETPDGHSAEAFHRRYTSFPDRPVVPRGTEPITGPNCSGNNPVGDPFKIKTWERIFAERIEYSRQWLPYRLNAQGECELDGEMWSQISLLLESLSKKRREWYGSDDDWEKRRKRMDIKIVKRGRRRRRSRSRSSAWHLANNLSQSAERLKRFVVALFFALVAVGSLLFSATQMNHMAETANHNRDETVRLFNKDEHAIRVHDEAIRSMNESIRALDIAVNSTFGHIETLQLTLKTYASMDSYFSEHTRILRGLNSLLHHRLSPELVHSKAMAISIKAQQEKFARMGYKLGLESLDDLFRAPTSWAMYGNSTLFVATHLSVYRTATRFKLLQPDKTMYFAPPPPVEGSGELSGFRDNYAFTVEGETDLLAVSQDGRYYQTINWSQLSDCSQVGNLYVCPNSNVLQKTETELSSCLVALYKGKIDQIRKLCRHKSVKRANYALQISGNRFLVRVNEPTRIRFECSGEDRNQRAHVGVETINDTALVQVAGMCSATCGDFVLNGRLEFSVQTTAYESQSLKVTDLFPELIREDKLWDWEKFRDFRVTYDPDGVPFEDVGKGFLRFKEDTTEDLISSIITWCSIAVIAVLSILALLRWGPKVRERMHTYSEKREARRLARAAAERAPAPDLGARAGADDSDSGLLGAYDRLNTNEYRSRASSCVGEGTEMYSRQPAFNPTPSLSKLDQDIKRQQKKNQLKKLQVEEQALDRTASPEYREAVHDLVKASGLNRSQSDANVSAAVPPAGAAATSSASTSRLSAASGGNETGIGRSRSSSFRANRLSVLALATASPSLETLLTDKTLRFKDDSDGLKLGWPVIVHETKPGRILHGLYRAEVQAALAQLPEEGDHRLTQAQAIKIELERLERARKKDDTYLLLTKLHTVLKDCSSPQVRIDALMFPERESES